MLSPLLLFLTIATKCVIFDNLSHTTKITFFSTTNSNLVIKSTIRYVHAFSSTSFTISFPAGASVLFFILWYKSHLLIYYPTSFVATSSSLSLTPLSSIYSYVLLPVYHNVIKLLLFSTSHLSVYTPSLLSILTLLKFPTHLLLTSSLPPFSFSFPLSSFIFCSCLLIFSINSVSGSSTTTLVISYIHFFFINFWFSL